MDKLIENILDDIGVKDGYARDKAKEFMQRIISDKADIPEDCLQCMTGCFVDGLRIAV